MVRFRAECSLREIPQRNHSRDRYLQAENRTLIDKKSDNNNTNSELNNSDWCSCWTRLRNNGNV